MQIKNRCNKGYDTRIKKANNIGDKYYVSKNGDDITIIRDNYYYEGFSLVVLLNNRDFWKSDRSDTHFVPSKSLHCTSIPVLSGGIFTPRKTTSTL